MLVNIHFQKWPLQFLKTIYTYIYNSDKGSGTEIKKNNINS